MSESWEREELKLNQIINLEDHIVISNVSQRSGKGGRPALIVNAKKYDAAQTQSLKMTVQCAKKGSMPLQGRA